MKTPKFAPGDKVTRIGIPEWGVGIVEYCGDREACIYWPSAEFANHVTTAWAWIGELEAAPFTTTPSKIAGAHQDEVRDITAQARAAVRIDRT